MSHISLKSVINITVKINTFYCNSAILYMSFRRHRNTASLDTFIIFLIVSFAYDHNPTTQVNDVNAAVICSTHCYQI